MSNKVEQIAKDEASRVAHLTRDAAASKTYLYPIKVSTSIVDKCTFSYGKYHR